MIEKLWAALWISWRFAGYKPRPISPRVVWAWLSQFEPRERSLLLRLVEHVQFISENELKRKLIAENERLVKRLNYAGIPNEKIIYVQFDDAGSSSAVTLNLLRDGGLLERLGFKWMDYKRVSDFHTLTNSIEEGAIIYVDDFIGSGGQFSKCHQFCSEYISGNFSQFLLAGCICEEAFKVLDERNVEPMPCLMHGKKERPLLGLKDVFTNKEIEALQVICKRVADNGSTGLGYGDMASMVVLYRNTPNNTPFAIRGTIGQVPFKGVFPRTTDLVSLSQAKARRN